ncbi:putative bifunctional diguanylate cyclase/phosphodiesterase [Actinoplanes sp. NPDC049681]|uniref:putative bifunctional diguanylate cyclase/phosphodiesterase n=1 Tax=Actinoplanes sp. NPDC049681 TaxID=3363905 RepID=UPI0037B16506
MTRQTSPRPWRAAHRCYLLVGTLVLVGGALLDPIIRNWLYVGVAASVIVAVVAGVRRHRPVWPLPWWLVIAAIAMSLLANFFWAMAMTPTGAPRFPSMGDVCYATMLPLVAWSNYRWVRPQERRSAAVDMGIVALGGGAVLWTLVVAPMLFDGRFSGLRLGSYLCYVAVDLVILVSTARVVVVSRVRTPAYRLMVGAAGLLVLTDTVNYTLLVNGASADRLTALGWLGSYLLIGAAALHPSMARSTGTVPGNPSPASRRRLATYVSLTAAITGLGVASLLAVVPGTDAVRLLVLEVLGGTMSVFLVVRLSQLAGLLNRRARVDELTGLGNRVVLQEQLCRAGARDRTLLVADLDGFRDFNDTFGHQAGDAVLIETGQRIRAAVPSGATVVRLGADEFAVLADEADGERLGRLILDAVREPYRLRGLSTPRFTAGIGVMTLEAGRAHPHGLRDADLALSGARAQGGGMVAVFDPAVHAERLANTALVAQLPEALAAGEFSMHYQPIVDLAGGRVAAAEALLRWTRPDGTRIGPDRFIPLAEQSGSIVALGDWVLATVCADLRRLWTEHQVPVTVNVSAHQLRDPLFSARLLALLDRHGVPGRALIVEITETVLMTSITDAASAVAQLQELRASGVRIAIDDFGTGYSSLAYLRELPVDILKMDGSFTARQIESGTPRDVAFVRTILDLSRSLELRTVAEAVETATQAERLRALGCDLAQGYHFARPAPVAELHAMLREQGRAEAGRSKKADLRIS